MFEIIKAHEAGGVPHPSTPNALQAEAFNRGQARILRRVGPRGQERPERVIVDHDRRRPTVVSSSASRRIVRASVTRVD